MVVRLKTDSDVVHFVQCHILHMVFPSGEFDKQAVRKAHIFCHCESTHLFFIIWFVLYLDISVLLTVCKFLILLSDSKATNFVMFIVVTYSHSYTKGNNSYSNNQTVTSYYDREEEHTLTGGKQTQTLLKLLQSSPKIKCPCTPSVLECVTFCKLSLYSGNRQLKLFLKYSKDGRFRAEAWCSLKLATEQTLHFQP